MGFVADNRRTEIVLVWVLKEWSMSKESTYKGVRGSDSDHVLGNSVMPVDDSRNCRVKSCPWGR